MRFFLKIIANFLGGFEFFLYLCGGKQTTRRRGSTDSIKNFLKKKLLKNLHISKEMLTFADVKRTFKKNKNMEEIISRAVSECFDTLRDNGIDLSYEIQDYVEELLLKEVENASN